MVMNVKNPEPTTNATPPVVHCRCGHDRAHAGVRPVKRYGWWGQMALIMGFTSRPVSIDVVCPTCGTVFESITDRETRERFRYEEPHIEDL
jgi:hypothetical protein